MDVRIAFFSTFSNRAKIRVREQSWRFQEDLKTQRERCRLARGRTMSAVPSRARHEQPELIDAQTRLEIPICD